MGVLSSWHWVVLLAVILLLFGRGRISTLMGDLGSGLGKFRREIKQHRASEPPADQS
ncbi:twin-arginine translocase TatA/TatE family subunit [Sinorhizobium medicae]|nr:twin-arginine translocase TatA/TatE family subunit [Sinorhizobium medicae]MDX0420172.1 twin-arginine translocase TatA/TatE family subunit [Sinorhizobium medicae]MDX1034720.1 twin-arginine translocase TatA/TatE family subunit [Sinorhizobium medicae]